MISQEIFATFGEIKEIEFGSERQRPWLNKGFAYIEYKTHADALNAMKHMDGGQIDGQVTLVLKASLMIVTNIQSWWFLKGPHSGSRPQSFPASNSS